MKYSKYNLFHQPLLNILNSSLSETFPAPSTPPVFETRPEDKGLQLLVLSSVFVV